MSVKNIKRVKYPEFLEQTPCTLILERGGLNEDGEPEAAVTVSAKVIYSEHSRRVIDKDGKTVMLTGKIFKKGDIAPELAHISGGQAIVNGVSYDIHAASRPRNPDGTVHHTELELI